MVKTIILPLLVTVPTFWLLLSRYLFAVYSDGSLASLVVRVSTVINAVVGLPTIFLALVMILAFAAASREATRKF